MGVSLTASWNSTGYNSYSSCIICIHSNSLKWLPNRTLLINVNEELGECLIAFDPPNLIQLEQFCALESTLSDLGG